MTFGKPMVTEMLNFLNKKASNEEATVEMLKLITDISDSLDQTEEQANLFGRAALYNSTQSSKPFQAIKDGGNRNLKGSDPEEFKRIVEGEKRESELARK